MKCKKTQKLNIFYEICTYQFSRNSQIFVDGCWGKKNLFAKIWESAKFSSTLRTFNFIYFTYGVWNFLRRLNGSDNFFQEIRGVWYIIQFLPHIEWPFGQFGNKSNEFGRIARAQRVQFKWTSSIYFELSWRPFI